MKRYLTASAAAALLLLPAMALAQTTAPQGTTTKPGAEAPPLPPVQAQPSQGTTATQPAPMGGMTHSAPADPKKADAKKADVNKKSDAKKADAKKPAATSGAKAASKKATTTAGKRSATGTTAARSNNPSDMSADQLNELELQRHQQMRAAAGGQFQGGQVQTPPQAAQPMQPGQPMPQRVSPQGSATSTQ